MHSRTNTVRGHVRAAQTDRTRLSRRHMCFVCTGYVCVCIIKVHHHADPKWSGVFFFSSSCCRQHFLGILGGGETPAVRPSFFVWYYYYLHFFAARDIHESACFLLLWCPPPPCQLVFGDGWGRGGRGTRRCSWVLRQRSHFWKTGIDLSLSLSLSIIRGLFLPVLFSSKQFLSSRNFTHTRARAGFPRPPQERGKTIIHHSPAAAPRLQARKQTRENVGKGPVLTDRKQTKSSFFPSSGEEEFPPCQKSKKKNRSQKHFGGRVNKKDRDRCPTCTLRFFRVFFLLSQNFDAFFLFMREIKMRTKEGELS